MEKGFTLIELLIVIGILAVLSVAVVITLNPAELLRQARDSTRISDLATLNTALALYLVDVSGTSYSLGNGLNCNVTLASVSVPAPWTAGCDADGAGVNYTPRFVAGAPTAAGPTPQSTTAGWMGVNFTSISSGAPVSSVPIDPTNTVGTNDDSAFFYAYRPGKQGGACTGTGIDCTQYELNANLESNKFRNGGTGGGDLEVNTKDGGNRDALYEVGTNLTL